MSSPVDQPRRRADWPARLATFVVALALAACQGAASPAPSPTPTAPAGPTPLVVDTDLSFDDIVALAFILREPSVDVRAVTVDGTGLVHCLPGLWVLRSLLDAMGATEVRIGCGRSEAKTGGHPFPDAWREASDAGYGIEFPMVPPSTVGPLTDPAQLLPEIIAAAGRPITVLSLGPFTNLEDALAADPTVKDGIERIVAMAGAVAVEGNVQPEGATKPLAAEWNVYADPVAAHVVLISGIPIVLVPLDATNAVPLTQAFIDKLDDDHGAAGADIVDELLARHGVLPGDYLWDALAAVALVDPSVVTLEEKRLDVDTTAGDSSGTLVESTSAPAMQVAMAADAAAFETRLLAGLRLGPQRAHPFELAGTIALTFDGTTCADDAPDTVPAGVWATDVAVASSDDTFAALLLFHEGASWQDLLDYVASAPDPTNQPTFVDLAASTVLWGGGRARVVATLGPGLYGFVCIPFKGEVGTVHPASGAFTVMP